mmetsp:Transcript_87468/g.171088  ORF Transcript_87468/g.171088 Transcript_87468/m.171088 type:complete len:161 (+) Transcript_87468:3-485(+)
MIKEFGALKVSFHDHQQVVEEKMQALRIQSSPRNKLQLEGEPTRGSNWRSQLGSTSPPAAATGNSSSFFSWVSPKANTTQAQSSDVGGNGSASTMDEVRALRAAMEEQMALLRAEREEIQRERQQQKEKDAKGMSQIMEMLQSMRQPNMHSDDDGPRTPR